ncbi:MAG: nickel pincer cofactor biosynthesis protein LarB [Myxococcales bacterium]|nr:nickel pincer cofactor biosynthesis protein LarB [Myxococcales bacterium]
MSAADPATFRWDVARRARTGLPEVAYAEGKSIAQLVHVFRVWQGHGAPGLATRVRPEQAAALVAAFPAIVSDALARTATLPARDPDREFPACAGDVVVVCAGTSDLAVAHEALATARFLGLSATLVADVGVAGLDRLLAVRDRLTRADVIVCVAGMEGALPSVVAGLVRAPVVAVPTSVGYGASLLGVTPLLAMLTSCAPGVVVVNIDNGFGAACAAWRILHAGRPRPEPA